MIMHTPLSHVVSGQWSHNLVPINLMAADQPLTNWHISRQLQLFFWISLSCIYIYIYTQYDIIYPMWYRTILYYIYTVYSIYPKIAKLDIHLPPHSKPHFFLSQIQLWLWHLWRAHGPGRPFGFEFGSPGFGRRPRRPHPWATGKKGKTTWLNLCIPSGNLT